MSHDFPARAVLPMASGFDSLNEALAGRYEVERELGVGGMAAVYLARDVRHDRRVAIKVLKPELAAIVGAERFLSEIKTTATLQHPHILPLFDSGDAKGLLYYVMPYVAGESLRDRLDREKQLPIEDAVRIATEVADALGHAHDRGLVHRDIKPANILLQDGRALVADFGIALAASHAGEQRLTETGLSLGTPHYMSPEQATGDRELDRRSDVYSLACVLHEMLAGEPPHVGPTAQSVVAKILADEPTGLRELRRTVPPNIEAAVLEGLEKLPADRFPDVARFASALLDPGFGLSEHTGSRTGGGRTWSAALIGAAAVLVPAALLWSTRGGPPSSGRSTRYAVDLGGHDPAPVDYGAGVALSADGRTFAYIARGVGSSRELWVKRSDEIRPRRIEGVNDPWQVFFSPQGEHLAVLSMGRLDIVSLTSGPETAVDDDGIWWGGGDWAEDGWLYVQGERAVIERLRPPEFERETVTTLREDEVEHVYPQVLPGGAVLFTVWHVSPDDGTAEVAVFDPDEDDHRILAPGSLARYTPDGHVLIVTRDGALSIAPFDLGRLELRGPPSPVLGGIGVGSIGGVDVSVSRTGELLFATGPDVDAGERELTWVDRDGIARPFAPGWRDEFESVAIAPDSGFVAVTVGDEYESSIWVKRPDGSPPTRLTFESGMNRRPAWQPGGQAVGFISDRDGGRALFAKRADGLGSAGRLTPIAPAVDEAHWSPDGRWLVYRTGFGGAERDILARHMSVDSTLVPISALEGVDEHSPAISPDGRFVAYVSDQAGPPEVWVRPFPNVEGGRWRVGEGSEPVWARSGRELYFRTTGHLVSARVRLQPTFGVARLDTLFETGEYLEGGVHQAYDAASDDSRLLMIRQPVAAPKLVIVNRVDALADDPD